ncbi:HIT domain-containing protein [Buchnera aphidicola]|uniref:HIT-like protein HinT n=1 Tax=Buchnera aphidicola subsp. Tuberolachnus salignus TaxID=98804 RepID=A0A170PBX0_BUCTT|nr:HIT domain-containing protein [Buchnera aphidicola]CUR53213.1 HIT-like protein HinT [Buchnera aphidicola (Tuberolachnus salignus)]
MNVEMIFSQIISKKKNLIYQDKKVTAFYDKYPKAPIHILIIPNILIPTANDVTKENKFFFMHMFYAATKIAKKIGIHKTGYRLILNCNKHAGQEIKYIHLHLLGGKFLGPLLSK